MKLKSSEPFWMVKNGIINSYPSLSKDEKADILIIGGGITGSLISHKCVELGYKTIVVDRQEIAHGSTSATTALLQYEIDVPLFELIEKVGEKGAVDSYSACFKAIDSLGEVIKKIKSECGYKKKDSLYYAAFKKDIPRLKKEFEARKKYGFPVEWLQPDEIEKRYCLKNTFGGILSMQGASMDAFRFTHDILAYNYKKGLKIYDRTVISKSEYKENKATFWTEYGNTITAKKVIYCNGYECVEILNEKFIRLQSTYAIVSEQNEKDQALLKNTLFWNTESPYLYFRTTEDNRLLIGGEDEEFVDSTRRDNLLLQKTRRLEKKLKKILPTYDFRTDFAWAGTFGETKDGLPYIGSHPDFPSSYFVLAFGGNGITFSIVAMEMLKAFLQDKEHPLSEWFKFGR